jgi:hypothetical protein
LKIITFAAEKIRAFPHAIRGTEAFVNGVNGRALPDILNRANVSRDSEPMSRNRLLEILVLVAILAIGVACVLPLFAPASNCGGNSAALFNVRRYVLLASMGAVESPDHSFHVKKVTPEQRKELADAAHDHWIPNARFLVSTLPLSEERSPLRRIVVVCDTPYSNVPHRWIGSAPPAHAAGFSDGSVELISPAQFAALDRSSFAFLDELYPTK